MNSSQTTLLFSSVRRATTYSGASHDDLLVGLASYGYFAWNVRRVHRSMDPVRMHTGSWAESGMNTSLCIKAGKDGFPKAKPRVYTTQTLGSWWAKRFLADTSLEKVTIIYIV